MVTKGTLINDIRNELGLQSEDANPTVNVVYPGNRKFSNIVKTASASSTGSSTIYTTPATEDFYLTSVSMSLTMDVACTGTQIYMDVVVNGETTVILQMRVQPSTAQSRELSLSFPHPVKLDKSSAIRITFTFGAGAAGRSGTITGFTL